MVQHSILAILSKKNKSLTPAELIKIHLQNPRHVITDEELKKVRLEGDSENKESPSANKEVINPYDYLDL